MACAPPPAASGEDRTGCRRERPRRRAGGVRWLLAVAALSAWLACSGAASAAESPRWAVLSTATPSSLEAETPRDEVQDVAVNATGGTFELTVASPNRLSSSCASEEATAPIAFDASASVVQAALEALACFPEGSIAVGGGPGGAQPYTIEFIGETYADRSRPVGLLGADGSHLTGANAGATVTEVSEGAPAPELIVSATNVGGAASDGSTIELEDTLPGGVTATSVVGYDAYHSGLALSSGGSAAMSCTGTTRILCTYGEAVDPGDILQVILKLAVAPGVSAPVSNQVSVSGGGVPGAAVSDPLSLGAGPAPFGPEPGSLLAALSTSQAGAHPNVTTAFTLNTNEPYAVAGYPKDVRFDLPPGLVGTAVGMPQCTMSAVVGQAASPDACAPDTMVGMATITVTEGNPNQADTIVTPVYNIAPAPGEPVAFAFDAFIFPVRLDTSVRSDGNYGVRVTAPDISQAGETLSTWVTIWGVPAEHSGPGPDESLFTLLGGNTFGGSSQSQSHVALLSSPQDCADPLTATMETDAWGKPGVFVDESVTMGSLTGCQQVPFGSSFSLLPDTLEAGAPAGYAFKLSVPQASSDDPQELASANVKDVKVTLPAGTVVSPSAAWGLRACSNEAFGLHSGAPGACPREAQVGTVEIRTPDLALPLQGQVYLAAPECDPCTPQDAEDGRMVRLFVQVLGEGEDGIVVKLEGHGEINQATGQITTVFADDPQLPFGELKLTLGGGPRAVLANPRACGTARSELDLTPWNSPLISDSTPFYEFNVDQNCFGPQFDPQFTAGTTNIQAGAYTPFTLSFGRADSDEYLTKIEQSLPPGLLGDIASIALCGEPQAAQGTCGSASLIGHVQVLTGPGADPFLVSGGQVFLTAGYGGAPYGLSIVVPAVAGPYTLAGTTGQGTVVVRAKIEVDPTDAHLTIASDALPTMLDGIPLQLKAVNVTVDRAGFIFNPTDCAKQAIAATLSSAQSARANVTSPFQVTNCASLAFRPSFTASTAGKTSRAHGASLSVKLAFPSGPQGSEANIHLVKVELPRQLPSRLTTLQKACAAAQFNANPAGCPPGSIVGHARARTPVLPVALEGPAYFVSHGGEAFPSLVIVLQGYGVTVDLTGSTFISKKGITSSTFKTVPDVPVADFELTLPEGPYSALAANGKPCKEKLAMPTELVAQNGTTIHRSTAIRVTGCTRARHKAASRGLRR